MSHSMAFASFATVVVLAVSVSGCANFATGETKLQAVKTVGIVSAVGHQMNFATAGLARVNHLPPSLLIWSGGLGDPIPPQTTTAFECPFQVSPRYLKPRALSARH